MSHRTERHAFLRRLVDERPVESQADLLEALTSAGQEVHQSTLSRDLRELGIHKVRGRYRLADAARAARTSSPTPAATPSATDGPGVDADGVTLPVVHGFIECGPHLIMVRTGTGQAPLLGVLLDSSDEPSVAGTVAGDDTVLVVTKGRRDQRAALTLLSAWFGEDKHDAL
jgi:transcriptional regulator of arginine metabolism